MKPNEYQCAVCNGVFEKGWSDEEAREELGENFPWCSVNDCELVCDDCYSKMMIEDFIDLNKKVKEAWGIK